MMKQIVIRDIKVLQAVAAEQARLEADGLRVSLAQAAGRRILKAQPAKPAKQTMEDIRDMAYTDGFR